MIPTTVWPSGVIASPSIPLLVTRPVRFDRVSASPSASNWATRNFAGTGRARSRRPLAVNSSIAGPYSSLMKSVP